jgi:hypothetical protein
MPPGSSHGVIACLIQLESLTQWEYSRIGVDRDRQAAATEFWRERFADQLSVDP